MPLFQFHLAERGLDVNEMLLSAVMSVIDVNITYKNMPMSG